jgi:drug/metabolite transporter (DMT)-like permease
LPSERVVGLSLAAMSAALWALGGIAAQELFSRHHVDPGWLAGVRMACGGLLLLVGAGASAAAPPCGC